MITTHYRWRLTIKYTRGATITREYRSHEVAQRNWKLISEQASIDWATVHVIKSVTQETDTYLGRAGRDFNDDGCRYRTLDYIPNPNHKEDE